MVYHRDTQAQYEGLREEWRNLPFIERQQMAAKLAEERGGSVHGWWDALNPTYNWGFTPEQVEAWFVTEGFSEVTLTQKYNINMRGQKS